MPTMLTLGVQPRRDPKALFSGLLVATVDDVPAAEALPSHPLIGSACVPAAALGEARVSEGHLVRLDRDPAELPPARAYVLDVQSDQLVDAVALDAGSPLVVLCRDGDIVETTTRVDQAGHHPAVDMADTEDRVADFLAVIAHAEHGFFAVAADADAALALVAGTVAALRGDDVRQALRAPDLRKLLSLHPDAAAATREVLLGVLVPDAPSVAADLGRRIDHVQDDNRSPFRSSTAQDA
ncbi:MAG: hypothetical protein WA931_05285 [Rhodococcus sp. (in: high G+C Gram-positive bacteria)]